MKVKRVFIYILIFQCILITSCERNDLYEFVKSYQKDITVEEPNGNQTNEENQGNPPENPPYSLVGQVTGYFYLNYQSYIIRVALQSDNKVIVGMSAGKKIKLNRLYDDISQLDGNFNVEYGNDSWYSAFMNFVTVQTDDKILVGFSKRRNTSNYADIVVVRFKADGNLDSQDFNNPNGFIELIQGDENNDNRIFSIHLQSNNYIIVSFLRTQINNNPITMTNINYRVVPDASSYQGLYAPSLTESINMKVAPDDKIVISGMKSVESNQRLAVGMLDSSGYLVSSFGNSGTYDFSHPGISYTGGYAESIAFQKDPQNPNNYKILVGGRWQPSGSGQEFVIMRLNQTGTTPVDTTFGNYLINGNSIGIFRYMPSGYSECVVRFLHVEPDGKIVACGSAIKNTKRRLIAFRIDKDGKNVDATFGNNGIVEFEDSSEYVDVRSCAVQSNGYIVCGIIKGTNNPGVVRIR